MRKTGNFSVLLGHALARVYHDYAHIRTLDCHLCAHNGEFLDPLVYPALAANAGSVDKNIFSVLIIYLRVHRIARRAGNVADYDALLAEDMVNER